MKFSLVVLGLAVACAVIFHTFAHHAVTVFISSAIALILLSKIMGDATESLSTHVGERSAGLVNVTLSNLAELIIIYVAISNNHIELAQAGIVGSIIGNLLLVMGFSIYVGCKRNCTLTFNHNVAVLFTNQLFLVGATLMLPTLFNDHIPAHRHGTLSNLLAVMLALSYVYFYRLSFTDKRFREVRQQAVEHARDGWGLPKSLLVLLGCGVGAFWMSELLVGEVELVSHQLNLSTMFIGFIILPLLGNIAEHFVAVVAARKGMTELSLSIAIGSASQVGMIVAPCAVLFGILTGNPFLLHFPNMPLAALILSLAASYLVLQDNQWNINEGIMLLAFYGSIALAFAFTQ